MFQAPVVAPNTLDTPYTFHREYGMNKNMQLTYNYSIAVWVECLQLMMWWIQKSSNVVRSESFMNSDQELASESSQMLVITTDLACVAVIIC